MNSDGLMKSLTQFVLLLVALACVFIITGIQSFAHIINSILLAAVTTLGKKPSLALIIPLLVILVVLVRIFLLASNSLTLNAN